MKDSWVAELTRVTKQPSIGIYFLLSSLFCAPGMLYAQSLTYTHDQHVEPAYEGWRQKPDGSYSMMFGYHNENWVETPHVPVGDNNYFSPGEVDQGQPTHFLPRRNRFIFEVDVPADWGDRELVWTLNVNGVERKAYGSLRADYVLDAITIAAEWGTFGGGASTPDQRSNTPPQVSLIGDGVRAARVGEPISISARVEDDGRPRSRPGARVGSEAELVRRMLTSPASRISPTKANELHMTWHVYRGSGKVKFDPPYPKAWEDYRTGGNSPWSPMWSAPAVPEDGVYQVSATFEEPGQYVIWGKVDDGMAVDHVYVTVNVAE